ncbi:SRPBCC family protein [Kitasatospora brasiliensis]|uniref:SRPBCC family protein n=1 Tax=Kitasatospora brasiliensis TaxID=3058040 RepID=UPI002930DD76|nr:SRPBCC family protein [Kitasatospora sp. K002]
MIELRELGFGDAEAVPRIYSAESTKHLGRAPMDAHEVFAYLARPGNLPRWNYALDTTERTSPGPIGVGRTYRQTRHLPRPAEEHFRVTAYDPPGLLTVDGDFGPFSGTATYRPTAVDRHTTRLVNSVHLTASGALKAVAALAAGERT